MSTSVPYIFDHTRHKLSVNTIKEPLDVLVFEGEEALSQPFTWRITVTCPAQDLDAEAFLGTPAQFGLYAEGAWTRKNLLGLPMPPVLPLKRIDGIITGFNRLGTSVDEARYELILQPRLALLSRGRQCRLYLHKSVSEIVEMVLRERHGFRGYDFLFSLAREYPRREQVMQYDESDLAFISRLLAEVGISYRFGNHATANLDVVEFFDDPRFYPFGVELPARSQSGFAVQDRDSVYDLQTRHQVVEKYVHVRSYDHHHADYIRHGEANQLGQLVLPDWSMKTWGEAYHYGDAFTAMDNPIRRDEKLLTESGYFYARLHHERYLNAKVRLSGRSDSASLAPGQVLKVLNDAPQAFAPGAVLTRLTFKASRDRSLEVQFEAIPYNERVAYRPPLLPRPNMAGTLPARVTSGKVNDLYGNIDIDGFYRVQFLFDRDPRQAGYESALLRLARPYAGDTHGLHLPLIPGTEVAIAFERGDPDRPYIAHALHDSQHPDHLNMLRRDFTRNVLRTPSNNKLRMEDERGKEHIKLSTEHSGKSQLNLGHLVDADKKKRGEGFELRTDGWGAIRAGKGLLISADEQGKAQGPVLAMQSAIDTLQQAGEQLQRLSENAQASQAEPADVQAQLNLLRQDLDQLKSAVLLLSAPKGIALSSGRHLQLAAADNLMLGAGAQADISVAKRLFIGVGQGLSAFVRKLGIKLIANQGPVLVQAQNDRMELLARHALDITSTEDEIRIVAKKKIIINAGGSYIRLDANGIESGTAGDYDVKAAHFEYSGAASMGATHPEYPKRLSKERLQLDLSQAINSSGRPWNGMPYRLFADG